ncbi:MAG: ATP-binding protein [Gemmatimonadota bacterium]
MSASTPDANQQEDLLGRLFCAHDLPEALSIFFDSVLSPGGIARALVLVREGEELKGILGMGWTSGEARSVRVSLEDTDPIATVYHAEVAADVAAPASLEADRQLRFLALPLSAPDPNKPPFGLILLSRKDGAPEVSSPLVQRVGVFGAVLARISERDQLLRGNRQLEQQRDLLTAIVNALPDPVLISGADNSIILENRRAESLFTAGEDDSEGRRRAVEINNLLFTSFLTRSTIGGPAGAGSGVSRELNLVDPSEGGDLLFEILSTPLPSTLSTENANVSVLRDVTDLKSATTELEHQFKRVRQAEVKSTRERDRLNLILENVGDPILVTDDQSNIILMNREAERLFDIPTGTALRSRRRQDVRANDTKFSSFISDFALNPDQTRVAQFNLTLPDSGLEFPAEVVSGKVLNERGEMTAIVSILHDLTKAVENERLASELGKLNESLEDRIRSATLELEERNRQLEWQRQELERAYRLKSQFLASMSHELRTPINALLGYTSLMRDQIYGELNRRQEEALARMYTASQHLLELVNDILDLAKIEAGKMPVHIEEVDVRHVIRELSHTIEPMVRRKNLEYQVELDQDLPVIRSDPTKVKQVVLNLLSNAIKFTHDGRVSVTTRAAEQDGIVIEVSDTGIGIREADVAKIFEDFRQVDQSSTREYGGTGLGLSITKKLLHLLGGTIHVESEFGGGSTFTVWLPEASQEIVLDEEISRVAREANEAVVE